MLIRAVINWFCCSSRKLSGTICLQTLLFNLSNSINLSFLLQRPLFLFHCYVINKMSPCTLSVFLSHFFFLFIRSPFWYLYTVYSPLSLLIHFFLRYGVILVPVIQSEGQQKSLRAWNRLLSQPERTDTFSAGITLFHYWQSPFLSISVSKPVNLSTSLSLYFFPLSPPLTSSGLLLPFFLKAHSFHFSLKGGQY